MIQADVRVITGLARRLAAASEDGRKELARATLSMRRNSKPAAGRIIRSKYNVKVGPLNNRLRAEAINGQYAVLIGVSAADLRRRIPIEDFSGTRVTRKGVIIGLTKDRPQTLVPRSYVSAGGITKNRKMLRTSNSRYPIRSISGLSASQMLFDEALIPKVVDALLVRAGNEVLRRLARLERR